MGNSGGKDVAEAVGNFGKERLREQGVPYKKEAIESLWRGRLWKDLKKK